MTVPRVIVVGAGPAGVRAAERLVAAGLHPAVIDEGSASGGQIYRRQPPNFRRQPSALYGTEASRAAAIHAAFDALGTAIDYQPQTLAWNVQNGVLHTLCRGRARQWSFDALILACGATDRLLPVPGWTLPGVYSLGAAQIALKAQACAIGKRVVFMGTGPLLYLVAYQYLKAGAEVVAVLDTSSQATQLRALPLLASRPEVLLKGSLMLWKLRRAAIPVHRSVTPIAIDGRPDGHAPGVTSVRVRLSPQRELRIHCDAVGIGYHLRSETQLADLAGCSFDFDVASRQWLPRIDSEGRSTVKGVYLAGDGVRILGADGAENAGRLAAIAILSDLGFGVSAEEKESLRRTQERMDRFRRGLATAFPWPSHLVSALPDETLVCRCEAITAGTLRRAVVQLGASDLNRAKAFSRVGMGRCQGRYCGLAGAEIAAAALCSEVEDVGRLRSQAPVKPLPVATSVDSE